VFFSREPAVRSPSAGSFRFPALGRPLPRSNAPPSTRKTTFPSAKPAVSGRRRGRSTRAFPARISRPLHEPPGGPAAHHAPVCRPVTSNEHQKNRPGERSATRRRLRGFRALPRRMFSPCRSKPGFGSPCSGELRGRADAPRHLRQSAALRPSREKSPEQFRARAAQPGPCPAILPLCFSSVAVAMAPALVCGRVYGVHTGAPGTTFLGARVCKVYSGLAPSMITIRQSHALGAYAARQFPGAQK